MLIGCLGELGTGKTLSGVIECYRAYKNGITVFSNQWLSFQHKPIHDVMDFIDVKEGLAFLDELWHIIEARRPTRILNEVMNLILLRSRKADYDVIYTQQYLTQVDRRIRRNTDIWIYPQMFGFPSKKNPRMFDTRFQISMIQHVINSEGQDLGKRYIEDVRPYFKMFNTKKDPYTFDVESLKIKMALMKTRGKF